MAGFQKNFVALLFFSPHRKTKWRHLSIHTLSERVAFVRT